VLFWCKHVINTIPIGFGLRLMNRINLYPALLPTYQHFSKYWRFSASAWQNKPKTTLTMAVWFSIFLGVRWRKQPEFLPFHPQRTHIWPSPNIHAELGAKCSPESSLSESTSDSLIDPQATLGPDSLHHHRYNKSHSGLHM
jgi:hypothetical protein